jgi:hypothetical protein
MTKAKKLATFSVPSSSVDEARNMLKKTPLEALALILMEAAKHAGKPNLVDGSNVVVSAIKQLDANFYVTLCVDPDCEQSEIKQR